MFNFGFRKRKKKLQIPAGAYELRDDEIENLVGGGTPVRHLQHPFTSSYWTQNTTHGLSTGGSDYSAGYAQMFPSASWQAEASFTTKLGEENKRMADLNY